MFIILSFSVVTRPRSEATQLFKPCWAQFGGTASYERTLKLFYFERSIVLINSTVIFSSSFKDEIEKEPLGEYHGLDLK
jgi:hypothetical protein